MENKTTKKLIILGAIVFSFALTNNVSANAPTYAFSNEPIIYQHNPTYSPAGFYASNNQGYPQYSYYQQYGYSVDSNPNSTITQTKPSVVNNYYYQTAPATVAKTSTTTIDKTTSETSTNKNISTNNTNETDDNVLGTSAYNGITALSLRGSGSFMPSSIWQWLFVVILILVIIVISRMFINKRTVVQESHTTSHSH